MTRIIVDRICRITAECISNLLGNGQALAPGGTLDARTAWRRQVMRKQAAILLGLLTLPVFFAGPGTHAQTLDARTVLQTAVKAMGSEALKCITYSGSGGYVGIVGQNHSPGDD